jgi:hypothetical protein
MGVTHSTESGVTAVVLAGVLGLSYYHFYMTPAEDDVGATTASSTSTTSADANSVKKSKKKKKKTKGLEGTRLDIPTTTTPSSQLAHSPHTIPGQFDQEQQQQAVPMTSNPKIKKPKKRTSAAQHLPATNEFAPSSTTTQRSSSPPPSDTPKGTTTTGVPDQEPSSQHYNTEGSWTRVVSRRKQGTDEQSIVDVTTSDAGLTSSVTGNSSPIEKEEEGSITSTDKLQTLAEKLVPKNPQTKIDELSPFFYSPPKKTLFLI